MMVITARYRSVPQDAAELLQLARNCREQAAKAAGELECGTRKQLAARARQVRRRARAAGYRAGERAAHAALAQTLQAAQEIYRSTVEQAEQDCLELVLAVAKEILATEVASSPSAVQARIALALDTLLERRALHITVHPQSHAQVSQAFPMLRSAIDTAESVPPGEALIETAAGRIELDWRRHLSAVAEKLRTKFAGAAP